jgi:hypothetical protein
MPRMYEAFVVSAAALYYKAGDFDGSIRIIERYGVNLQRQYYKMRLEEIIRALIQTN